jgi:hypothetical protein
VTVVVAVTLVFIAAALLLGILDLRHSRRVARAT